LPKASVLLESAFKEEEERSNHFKPLSLLASSAVKQVWCSPPLFVQLSTDLCSRALVVLHCQVLALVFSHSVVIPIVVFIVVLPQAVLLFFVALAF
jgi:hypothetical protein